MEKNNYLNKLVLFPACAHFYFSKKNEEIRSRLREFEYLEK